MKFKFLNKKQEKTDESKLIQKSSTHDPANYLLCSSAALIVIAFGLITIDLMNENTNTWKVKLYNSRGEVVETFTTDTKPKSQRKEDGVLIQKQDGSKLIWPDGYEIKEIDPQEKKEQVNVRR